MLYLLWGSASSYNLWRILLHLTVLSAHDCWCPIVPLQPTLAQASKELQREQSNTASPPTPSYQPTKTRRAHLPWPDTSVHSLPKILWQPQVISKKYVLTEKEKILFKAFSFLMRQLTSSKYFLSGILWGLTFYKKLIFAQKRKKPSLLAQFILSLNSQRPTICGTLQAWKQSSKIHCTTHTGQALL